MIFLARFYGVGMCIVLCLVQSEGLNVSACYGTDRDCDYFTLNCTESSHVIHLQSLYAGHKTNELCANVSDHCTHSSTCCSRNSNDVVQRFNVKNTFDTYTNCSGKTFCKDIQSPWQLMTDGNPSTYVHMQYLCDKKEEKLNFCGGSSGRETSEAAQSVDVMFDGSAETFNASQASKTCQCRISNTNSEPRNITLHITDLRLQTYYRNENQTAECSAANFTSDVLNSLCVNTTNHHDDNFIYNKTYELTLSGMATSDITLNNIYQNGERDAPAMVWISLNPQNGETLSVSCYEVTPATLTTRTSTPSTSTSTSSPTTHGPENIPLTTILDDSEAEMRVVYLAVFIPVGYIVIVLIVICCCCMCRKGTMTKKSKEPVLNNGIVEERGRINYVTVEEKGRINYDTVQEKGPINYIHEPNLASSTVADDDSYFIPVGYYTASQNYGYTPRQNNMYTDTEVWKPQRMYQDEPSLPHGNVIHIRMGTARPEHSHAPSIVSTGNEQYGYSLTEYVDDDVNDPTPTNQDAGPSQTNVVYLNVDNTELNDTN